MAHRRALPVLAVLALAGGVLLADGCGPGVDLKKISVVDVLSGYADGGVLTEGAMAGWNHMLPSITFRLRNDSATPMSGVRLTAAFWPEGKDAELDSLELPGIPADQLLAPGATTEPITVRSNVGFNLEAARSELFKQTLFVDITAKLFAKHSGQIVPIGAFKLDRRLIPSTQAAKLP